MPNRIQRRRAKGWRAPAGAVYVGRPSVYGNPFPAATYGAARAVELFRAFATGVFVDVPEYRPAERRLYDGTDATLTLGELAAIFLRGKDLMCWCPLDEPCHADVLLEVANA